jgi:ornithine cyclodeaminase/alanine dehydrogenase-like protein (mu-crystallin family)
VTADPAALKLLTRADIARLMDFEAYVESVSVGFQAHREGRTLTPGVLHVPASEGGFHVKAAGLVARGRSFVAVKINGNYPSNRVRHGLPTIQGAILLADADNGTPLALLDSAEITVQRTGAATALAARFGARANARSAAICGCGLQGHAQLQALAYGRALQRVRVWDIERSAAEALATQVSARYGFDVLVADSPGEAVRGADLIATCTPSRSAYIGVEDVDAGAFVAAVGADSQGKQELAPALLARARVIADLADQALCMGDCQHAMAAGLMGRADIVAELGELLAGEARARTNDEEIVIFDSTGTALQDVAAAIEVYARACVAGAGLEVRLA